MRDINWKEPIYCPDKRIDQLEAQVEALRENVMTFDEWIQKWRDAQPDGKLPHDLEEGAEEAWDYQQARIDELEKLLDPETLARKIGDWDFTHNDDYFCFKFGGDGDNGEMLIEALAALLKETAQ
jgi:hypothetical protein